MAMRSHSSRAVEWNIETQRSPGKVFGDSFAAALMAPLRGASSRETDVLDYNGRG
jgi:hypothetical protein